MRQHRPAEVLVDHASKPRRRSRCELFFEFHALQLAAFLNERQEQY
jgi:hypothetical protein